MEEVKENLVKKSINLGDLVLEYVKRSPKEKARPKRGRPILPDNEKSSQLSITLTPEDIDFLDRSSEKDSSGRPRRSKLIRGLISEVNESRRREKDQTRLLRKLLGDIQILLSNYSKEKKGLDQLEKRIGELKMVLDILLLPDRVLKRELSENEYSSLTFCLNYLSNKGYKVASRH